MKDGETIEVKGSAKAPYILKRVGDTYSCTCPAWRNQSQPINLRTCKHLRKALGDKFESERLGGSLTVKAAPTKSKVTVVPPALLLAERWTPDMDPTGWWISEKLDGVRAYWDGKNFISRLGNKFAPPAWFKEGMPNMKLDGELWMGRGLLQKTVSVVRSAGLDDPWKKITYMVFDEIRSDMAFEDRMQFLRSCRPELPKHVVLVDQSQCLGFEHLSLELERVEKMGGEGLMLREPGSMYEGNRSSTLLKVKTFLDDEAIVTGYEPGKGNRLGMVGAFLVRGLGKFKNKEFKVGTGQSHEDLRNPPPIGAKITFRYVASAVSDDGLPKPAAYVGLAIDK